MFSKEAASHYVEHVWNSTIFKSSLLLVAMHINKFVTRKIYYNYDYVAKFRIKEKCVPILTYVFLMTRSYFFQQKTFQMICRSIPSL